VGGVGSIALRGGEIAIQWRGGGVGETGGKKIRQKRKGRTTKK